jgi:hypothetical protein
MVAPQYETPAQATGVALLSKHAASEFVSAVVTFYTTAFPVRILRQTSEPFDYFNILIIFLDNPSKGNGTTSRWCRFAQSLLFK